MDRHAEVSGRALLLALAGWLVVGAAIYGLVIAAPRHFAHAFYKEHLGDFASVFLLLAYGALFAALLFAFGGPAGLRDRLGFRFTSAAHLLVAPAVWLLTVVVGALISIPFSPWLGPPQSNATGLARDARDPFAAVVVVVTAILVAPACEELLFRGALFGWLRRHLPVPVAAPLSAAVFGGAHLFPPGLVLLFTFGVSAALMYQWTGSTLNSFVMHALQNTVALLAVFTGFTGGH